MECFDIIGDFFDRLVEYRDHFEIVLVTCISFVSNETLDAPDKSLDP